jgi:hypothetical protein
MAGRFKTDHFDRRVQGGRRVKTGHFDHRVRGY